MAAATEQDGPAGFDDDDNLLLRGVTWAGLDAAADVLIREKRIAAIRPVDAAPRWFCLPPLADLHVHANRAYTPAEVRPESLADAVINVRKLLDAFTEDDHRRQARRLADHAWAKGTTTLRTHADLSPATGLKAVIGSLAASADIAVRQRMDVVAFASSRCDPASADGARLLEQAVAEGAAFLGAAPAFCEHPGASIEAVLDLAMSLDVPVDLHLDEHLDGDASFSEKLADATLARGLGGRVTLSHGCAVAM
ncbi:MAG: hypothetical protein HKO62_12170, partial [Gammaproteobacteria bacterium]|nr:hypothetical protein [Gammaproteobacteria bacterium]